ncbi:MAG TPA: cytochrome c peroxidase, partial [Usitatibacter sp.]|nr:cytochrome c peroxidase [Usitatibacter sp.]
SRLPTTTVLNAALQVSAHWRGDRTGVEDQAIKALVGPPSFGNASFDAAVAKMKAIPGYAAMFRKAFPAEADPVTVQNWGKAIGAYERTLVTPSPFDDYLNGNVQALGEKARTGLAKFIETGCASCHNGVGVGGATYQKFGVVAEYWKETHSEPVDKGRFDVTNSPADMYVFKVPGLRNVAMTAPYFHDGSVGSLADAVRIMAKVQLGKELAPDDVQAIVAFLDSLTGRLPAEFQPAVLPAAEFPVAAR